MSLGKQRCDRCGCEAEATIMSMFCTEIICMDCREKEGEHSLYQEAVDAEDDQIRQGNLSFEGIGKPADL